MKLRRRFTVIRTQIVCNFQNRTSPLCILMSQQVKTDRGSGVCLHTENFETKYTYPWHGTEKK